MSLTLREIRRQRITGALPLGAATSLLLRLPQGAREDAAVDPIEAIQALRAESADASCKRLREFPWQTNGLPGACAATLTLLSPAADLLAAHVPGIAQRLMQVVAYGEGWQLPAALALSLYMLLQLPDDQVAADAPKLLPCLESLKG